ncbi:uncharacterized protein LOC131146048 isoform X2 [Malania oleifera]|uniref:uncharacterized protein LOC131146048 isoform X2 n=1 Tax=Malania oleifera TaxID=397392 RepID=UPI0025AE678C|nr:uncharacterized protein LOC131146048 isoform X2 [Malania oleifera]
MVSSRFRAVPLVASPSYPNSVAWSDENLLAVATGHFVTVLNPAMPTGPRGLVMIPSTSRPFPIGVIKREDLLSGCLLSTCLSRDCRPLARSISWSPLGFAPNGGCLLAVCTTEGRVKLYRPPFCEFSSEWVEVMDVSDMLCEYLANVNFGELGSPSLKSSFKEATEPCIESECVDDLPISALRKKSKGRRANELGAINEDLETSEGQFLHPGTSSSCQTENFFTAVAEEVVFPCSILKEGSSVEVLRLDGSQRVWVAGVLEHLTGVKALVAFPETNGKQDGQVEINLEFDEICESNILKDSMANLENHSPEVRPSMHVGNLPEEVKLANCDGVGNILQNGQAVEAWTNDRWIEGLFMGFDEGGVLVKFHGEIGSSILNANSVRIAPVWISQKKSWQVILVKIEMKGEELCEVVEMESENMKHINPYQIVPVSKSKVKPQKKIPENCIFPQITAAQYASRSAMLSSLVAVWSPVLQLPSEIGPVPTSNSSEFCSLLAVGGKSGKISLWRVHGPQCYSIGQGTVHDAAMLVGLLQAHDAWITAIVCASLALTASMPQVLLATGSSNGSVKMWLGSCEELLKSSEVNCAPFVLLNEVSSIGSVPVSVLSLATPVQYQHKIVLAIGRVSGSFEVWICDLSTGNFDKAGSYDVHDHVVTGLAWAFDGICLYSCSQDNSVHSWILHGKSLLEAPIPSNTLDVKSSIDIPNASDSCFGVAISPGNLIIALARSFDSDLLNPMYQARSMKGAVEFFWTGGQQLDILSNKYLELGIGNFPGFSEKELAYWEHNVLWSLKRFQNVDRPLVVWDIMAALMAFKQCVPKYVEHILFKWLSASYVGSHLCLSTEEILSHTFRLLSKITSRQLHLLSVICRRVMLSAIKEDTNNRRQQNLVGIYGVEELGRKLLLGCETELRERLVGFSISSALYHASCSASNISRAGYWHPVGLAQMEQWVALNRPHVQDKLQFLASEVGKLVGRLQPVCDYVPEEQCSYCSASVPFESPEVAFCQNGQNHKLARCAVSMRVCPTTPLWFCMCCQRRVSELAPDALFSMPKYPSDLKSSIEASTLQVLPKPLCPFCGVLLQRLQPDFLLSAAPV